MPLLPSCIGELPRWTYTRRLPWLIAAVMASGCGDSPVGSAGSGVDPMAAGEVVIYAGPVAELAERPTRAPSLSVSASGTLDGQVSGADITRTADSTFTNVTFERIGHLVPLTNMTIAGAVFDGWLTVIDADSLKKTDGWDGQAGGNFANEPSPSTIAFWVCTGDRALGEDLCPERDNRRDIIFKRPISRLNIFYTAVNPSTVEVYDADEQLLMTQTLPPTLNEPNPAGDDPSDEGQLRSWFPIKIERPDNVIGRVRLIGSPNQVGIDSHEFVMVNYAPTAVAGGPYATDEGAPVTLDGSLSFDPINAQGAPHPEADPIVEYRWDFGDGNTGTGPNPTHTYTASGTYSATLTVRDPNQVWSLDPATTTVTVANLPPVVQVGGDVTLPAGGFTLSRTGSFADPGEESGWTAMVNYGDGSGAKPLALNPDRTFALSHTYGASGIFTVTITVSDGQPGGTGSASFQVTVGNRAPVVHAIAAVVTSANTPLAVTGSFEDPDPDQWTATVNYGDGSGTKPLALSASKTFSLNHVYTAGGSYTVTVTVVDSRGASGSTSFGVTVLPPSTLTHIQVHPESIELASCRAGDDRDEDDDDGDGCGMLTVRVFADGSFNPRDVDPATLTLGDGQGSDTPVARHRNGSPMVVVTPKALIAKFRRSALIEQGELVPQTKELMLRGRLKSGLFFHGTDRVRVIP